MAAAAALFAACSSNDLAEEKAPQTTQQTVDEQAVTFEAYTSRGTTRAGWAGTLDTDALKDATKANGFGVFGYYTNGELYNETARPDFMYNQQVTYDGSQWVYSPIKYWPNEFGTNAASEEIDRLTFFAYAPYAASNPTTGVVNGDVNNGIVGMTRNTTSGNPLIKYYANLTPADGVDLCWGVANNDFTSSVDGAVNKVKEGEPYIDVIKPKVSDKIHFDFKHALAQLNIQIDTDVDVLSHSTSALDSYTRIYVRSITFEGFTTKGALDLNSDVTSGTTPNWFDISGNSKLSLDPITVFDGRRDGKEGVPTVYGKNETPADLNPVIVQSGAYTTTLTDGVYSTFTSATDGVTNTAVNLFNSATLTAPVLVIPTGEPMKVTIVYDVETADASLSGYLSDGATRGSTIENAITQDIKISTGDMTLDSGKKYTVKLHLGMTSVKFDAEVTDWEDAANSDVDLPYNAGAGAAGAPMTVNVGSAAISLVSTLSGLTAGNSVEVSRSSADVTAPTVSPSTVGADGKVVVNYGATENTTINNRTAGIITVTEKTTGSTPAVVTTTQITVKQAAHELGLATSSASKDGDGVYARSTGYYDFVLTSTATGFTDWSTATVTVKDGSTTLTAGTDYTWTPGSKNLTFTGAQPAASSSNTLEVTVKAGDAAAETIKVKITKG